jgi:hypothetical protein
MYSVGLFESVDRFSSIASASETSPKLRPRLLDDLEERFSLWN